MSDEKTGMNQAADLSGQDNPQTNAEDLALMSPEQIADLQKQAKELYDGIKNVSDDVNGQFELLVLQLKKIRGIIQKQNNLDAAYGTWFADLIRQATPATSYDKNAALDNDMLINLTRELSQQNFSCAKERQELEAIKREIAEKRKELDALDDRIKDEYDRKRQEKEAELAGFDSRIQEKQRELDSLNQEIRNAQIVIKTYEAASGEDFEGFAIPDGAKSGHIYLCGSYASVDVTATPQIMRNVLTGIDPEAAPDENLFRHMGQPQIVIRKLPDGRVMAKSQTAKRPNKVDGKQLSCEAETELRQGALIEMTDGKGNTRTVKVYIAV
jgi:hypothetical protein